MRIQIAPIDLLGRGHDQFALVVRQKPQLRIHLPAAARFKKP